MLKHFTSLFLELKCPFFFCSSNSITPATNWQYSCPCYYILTAKTPLEIWKEKFCEQFVELQLW